MVEHIWALRSRWSSLWIGSGWRPGSVEHASGYAVDLMLSTSVGREPAPVQKADGDRLAAWLIAHRRELGLRGLIWHGRIIGYSDSDWAKWRPLTWKPSDASNQHRDHIHMYGLTSMGVPDSMDEDAEETPDVEPDWDGSSFPGAAAFRSGEDHPAVTIAQKRLKTHGYDPGDIDGYWGPKTAAATAAFQRAQGWSGSDADGIPGPVTWSRLLAAPTASAPVVVDLSRLIAAAKADPPKSGTPVSYSGVRTVESALVAEGLLAKRYFDGHFGTATVAAYAAWQRRCGYRGRDADGIPGMDSLRRLGAKHGFTAKA